MFDEKKNTSMGKIILLNKIKLYYFNSNEQKWSRRILKIFTMPL